MDGWRKYTVLGLVVCLMYLPLADTGVAADDIQLPNPGLTKRQVNQFGVGANVKVALANGKKLKGPIQSVEEGGFVLASNSAGLPTRVAYDEVSQLKLAKVTYKAKGHPDAAEAKRVAAGLGVGHHIMIKTSEGMEYHGNIVALDAESVTVLPDHTTAPVQIAYNSVQQMGPNMSKTTEAVIIIAVCVGVALAIIIPLAIIASNE